MTVAAAAPPPYGTRVNIDSVADAEVARDLHLLARVHRERDEAVDVARRQPGVVERRLHRLARELQLGAARLLRELGLADARDRGAVRGATRLTTPPREREADRGRAADVLAEVVHRPELDLDDALVAVALRLAGDRAGVRRACEPGNTGTPRRIASCCTIASGPAQSVRKRLQ